MCRTHAALIDRDDERFTVELLGDWKYAAEDRARRLLGQPRGCATGKLASVSPATRLGAQLTVIVEEEYIPITYIFDPDANNARLTWFVSALVIQFSIQKSYQLKNAVVEHLSRARKQVAEVAAPTERDSYGRIGQTHGELGFEVELERWAESLNSPIAKANTLIGLANGILDREEKSK